MQSQRGMDDLKWFHHFKKVFQAIHKSEKSKYLDPKFGPSMYPLMKYLMSKHGGSKNPSIMSMNMSQTSTGNNGFPFNDSQSMSSFYSNNE